MGCLHAKWYMLVWLTIDLAELSRGVNLEFGARLRMPDGSTIEQRQSKHLAFGNASKIVLTDAPSSTRTGNRGRAFGALATKTTQNGPSSTKTESIQTTRYATGTTKGSTEKPKVIDKTKVKIPQKPQTKAIPVNKSSYCNDCTNEDMLEAFKKKNLVPSQNLQFNRIEPFWPFSNFSTIHLSNGFKLPKEQTDAFPYKSLPDRFKDTTFFFSHVGPNSFEYRAQFHHSLNEFEPTKFFKPFVNEYPDFPKITFPPFPSFPESPPNIFQQKPALPEFPGLNDVPFPTLEPEIKRILEPALKNQGDIIVPEDKIKFPKHFDVVLGGVSTKYPKIFQFNDERINIEDFEKEKKFQAQMNGINLINEPDSVQRDHLLILHGGIFTVKEPPLYNRKLARKRRPRYRDGSKIVTH